MRVTRTLAFAVVALAAIPAAAHTVWLKPAAGAGRYVVMFGGHEGKAESYPPAKLKEIVAYAADGRTLPVTRSVDEAGRVEIRVRGRATLITAHFENGVYSTTPEGRSVNTPMDQTAGAVKAVKAVKYHKTIVAWTVRATRPVGQKMEVVPLDAAAPRAGAPMRVRVLLDGAPLAGVRLGRGEDKPGGGGTTDARGIATFVPEHGFNKLWAGKRIEVTGDSRYTELSYEYLLGFDAR